MVEKWYKPKVHTGWEKGQPLEKRRAKVLKAHKGDELAAARAMQALANVTQDNETKQEAAKDADYFYQEHLHKQLPPHPRYRNEPTITPKMPRLK